MVKTKRVYDDPAQDDGFRILVDRLWPRGLRKDEAAIDLWLKDVAPSDKLRKWFKHDRTKWDEFKRRYFKELGDREEAVDAVVDKASQGTVTLLFGAKDESRNNAAALQEFIEQEIPPS